MDGDQRFYERPGFLPISWTVASLIWYAVQMYRMFITGGLSGSFIINVIIDVVLFGAGIFLWMAFFSQFTLPVLHFRERQKIFDRVMSSAMGGSGPAIFVEDGVLRAGKGEEKKRGAGVLWLDSASAVQLRTNTKFTRSIGPGVHFTDGGEYIAGVVDLHTQTQGLGPQGKDKPFDARPDTMSDDEFSAIQKRRGETSAMTRDGIEVVPNINVTFKIDAEPVEGDGPGSRFGYRDTEKPEDNPIFKAIAGEGINPNLPVSKQTVAWNKLPALIAADLWREYLSKFTLRDLFNPVHEIPPDKPAPLQPALHETTALYEPVIASTARNAWQDSIAELLHEFNHILIGWINQLEADSTTPASKEKEPAASHPTGSGTARKGTALEVINAMIKARMTQERVEELDDNGKRTGREIESPEHKWLKSRGLKVVSAGAGSLRFSSVIEEQLVRQWNATWLNNAKAERDAIERLRKQKELKGQDESRRKFIHELSRSLLKTRPNRGPATINHMLTFSRDELIRQDRLQRRLSNEITELDEIIQWVQERS